MLLLLAVSGAVTWGMLASFVDDRPQRVVVVERVTYWSGWSATEDDLKGMVLGTLSALRTPCFVPASNADRLPGCVYPLCDSLHCHPPMILKDMTTPPVTQ